MLETIRREGNVTLDEYDVEGGTRFQGILLHNIPGVSGYKMVRSGDPEWDDVLKATSIDILTVATLGLGRVLSQPAKTGAKWLTNKMSRTSGHSVMKQIGRGATKQTTGLSYSSMSREVGRRCVK